jgi:hypothetical protein
VAPVVLNWSKLKVTSLHRRNIVSLSSRRSPLSEPAEAPAQGIESPDAYFEAGPSEIALLLEAGDTAVNPNRWTEIMALRREKFSQAMATLAPIVPRVRPVHHVDLIKYAQSAGLY